MQPEESTSMRNMNAAPSMMQRARSDEGCWQKGGDVEIARFGLGPEKVEKMPTWIKRRPLTCQSLCSKNTPMHLYCALLRICEMDDIEAFEA